MYHLGLSMVVPGMSHTDAQRVLHASRISLCGNRGHLFCMLWLVASLCFLLFPASVFALNTTPSAEKSLRVGYCMNCGINGSAEQGNFSGYNYDYLQEIAKYTGWQYEFVLGTWDECLQRLKKGEIDLLGPMQRTDQRLQDFAFPEREMGYEYGVMYAHADNVTVHYEDFESFRGLRVGLVRGNYYNEPFEAYQLANGFRMEPVYFDEPLDAAQALQDRSVDVIVVSSFLAVTNVKLISRFSVEPFYLATSKNRSDIVQGLNMALEAIRTNDVYFDASLYARYYRFDVSTMPAFTRAEENYLRAGRPLRMAFLNNHPPLEYAEDNGVIRGIIPDLMRAMANHGKLKLEFVGVSSFDEAIRGIRTGELDALASYGTMENSYSPRWLRLSVPYMSVPVVFVGRKDLPGDKQMRIAVPSDYTTLVEYVENNYKEAVIDHYPTFMDCLRAVQSGRAHATLVSSYLYDKLTGSPDFRNIQLISVTSKPLVLSIGLSSGLSPVVFDIIHKALARLTVRDMDDSVIANTSRETQLTFEMVLREYAWHIALGVCVFILLATGMYIRLRRETEKRLWRMAYLDELTGYGNWYKFEQDASQLRVRAPYAFALIDIDDFKLVNDYFGYTAGSNALVHMAKIIQDALQPGEAAARRGGDIFGLLLHYRGEANLNKRLQGIQDNIVSLRLTDDESRILHTVCGVCVDSHPEIPLNSLYDRANHARKTLKPAHENARAFYDEHMHARILQEQEIEQHMEQALRDGEFHVYFQPKYDLAKESIMGAEALARWRHPQRGIIQPSAFIPLFEKNGFILKLDMYMLEQVCKCMRMWLDRGYNPVPVAVNISKVHIHTVNFVRNVREIVEYYAIPPYLIELELTESAFFDNTSVLLSTMRQLAEIGFTLSLDDFGSGYSSLNMLKSLPVNVLKLDRGFFDAGEAEERARLIISSVIQMARALHMKVVAEGVETQEQVDFLRSADCDYIQGYFYSTPKPQELYEKMVYPIGDGR